MIIADGGVGIEENLNVGGVLNVVNSFSAAGATVNGNLVVTGTFTPILYDSMETDITATDTLTNGGCYIVKPSAAATTITLPTPSAGIRFKFIVENNGQNVIIQTNHASLYDFRGYAFVTDTNNNTTTTYKANDSTHDHLKLLTVGVGNNYTGGIIEMTGVDATHWFVEAKLFTSDAPVDPWATS